MQKRKSLLLSQSTPQRCILYYTPRFNAGSRRPVCTQHRGYLRLSRITLMTTRLHLWRQTALPKEGGREFQASSHV